MGYQVIDPTDIDPMPDRPSTVRELSDHYVPPADLGKSVSGGNRDLSAEPTRGPRNVGMRIYEARPGEQLPQRYHYHDEQEEMFFVLEGTLHVETPEGEYVVEENQLFVVEPGSPHRSFVPEDGDSLVRVLSIGAPSYRVMGRSDGHAYEPE